MAQSLENPVVRKIIAYLKKMGPQCCWYMRTSGGPWGRRGLPDIIGTWKGVFFALEVKRPGGKATKLQLRELEKIRTAGGRAGVVTNVKEAGYVIFGVNNGRE